MLGVYTTEMACGRVATEEVWSKGHLVCLDFLEHVSERTMSREVDIGERTTEILAYRKMGCTCREFRPYINDVAVRNKFHYEIEAMKENFPTNDVLRRWM